MAKIIIEGNVGKVDFGETGDNHFISFQVAENFSYFDQQKQQWVDKGTQWHDCIMFIRKDNPKKYERYSKFIKVGAGLMIHGKTSVSPSDEKDDKGKPKYLNPYVNVDEIALTTIRLASVQYKPKSTNVAGVINDSELQQQAQVQGQQPPSNQVQAPTQVAQPPVAAPQGAQTAQPAQSPQSQTTPLDEPFPGAGDEDVNF